MIIRPPLETEIVVLVPGAAAVHRRLDDLGPWFTVGQDAVNELVVADRFVSSGRHCGFRRTAEGLWLESFGHPNGELVNGVRVQGRRLLETGDRISIGQTTILVLHRLAGRAEAAAPLVAAVLAAPDDRAVLDNVLATAWAYGPERFLRAVLARTGQSWEGEVSFAYHDEYPDEIAAGVSLDYLGTELLVSEAELDRHVVEYAARRLAERPEPALASLVARLDARGRP